MEVEPLVETVPDSSAAGASEAAEEAGAEEAGAEDAGAEEALSLEVELPQAANPKIIKLDAKTDMNFFIFIFLSQPPRRE